MDDRLTRLSRRSHARQRRARARPHLPRAPARSVDENPITAPSGSSSSRRQRRHRGPGACPGRADRAWWPPRGSAGRQLFQASPASARRPAVGPTSASMIDTTTLSVSRRCEVLGDHLRHCLALGLGDLGEAVAGEIAQPHHAPLRLVLEGHVEEVERPRAAGGIRHPHQLLRWARALIIDDLPTFERPTKATSGTGSPGYCSSFVAVVTKAASTTRSSIGERRG